MISLQLCKGPAMAVLVLVLVLVPAGCVPDLLHVVPGVSAVDPGNGSDGLPICSGARAVTAKKIYCQKPSNYGPFELFKKIF